MTRSKVKLLLNAEPFGFGPTAAIASFFPHLREHFETIGYIGKGHTLDLQKELAYDTVYDITDLNAENEREVLQEVFKQYDLVLTALDFSFAEEAKKAGKDVIVYDPLTWYWKSIPDRLQNVDLYLAQKFFGVEEKLQNMDGVMPETHLVSPIIGKPEPRKEGKHVLINLGGLRNPIMSLDEINDYAHLMADTIQSCLPEEEQIYIATSKGVAISLGDNTSKTYSKSKMEGLIANSKYAFMTPGLGNIYDAAQQQVPVIWLPPANDSQGQQLDLLEINNMVDGSMDWKHFLGSKIDYKADQNEVLGEIVRAINSTMKDSDLQRKLKEWTQAQISNIENARTSSLSKLVEEFGFNGDRQVAEKVIEYAKSMERVQ